MKIAKNGASPDMPATPMIDRDIRIAVAAQVAAGSAGTLAQQVGVVSKKAGWTELQAVQAVNMGAEAIADAAVRVADAIIARATKVQ